MKETVFIPSFGNRPRNLVGREDILSQVKENLTSAVGSKERSILLLGQRGYGKTVLLLEIAEIAKSCNYVVASPSVVTSELLNRIIEKIEEDSKNIIKNEDKHISGGSVGFLGFSAGVQFSDKSSSKSFGYRISHIARALSQEKRGLLILIDEIQGNSKELKELIVSYQEMIGEGLNVALVMAGLPSAISSVLNDKVLTFLNRSTKIEVGPIKMADIVSYYSSTFEKINISINSNLLIKISEKTYGSPYMLQLLGHYIESFSFSKKVLSEDDFTYILPLAEKEFIQDICEPTLAPLSEKDADFLKAMAQDEEISSISDIASRLNVKSDYIQVYKKRLLDAGIIVSPMRAKVKCVIPHLLEYVRTF
ncbi:MAG: ATP-binding protein [Sphaerochaetaceae bacterium]|nr:ATP-binding protein [Sphaerochaetaceae bacterium]